MIVVHLHLKFILLNMKNTILIIVVFIINIFSVKSQGTSIEEVNHSVFGSATSEKTYNDKDILIQEAIFTTDPLFTKGNVELGEFIFYNKNGTINCKGGFIKPKEQKSTWSASQRKKEGKWFVYNDDQILKSSINYKDDVQDGEFIYYHNNGKISRKGKKIDRRIVGTEETFFNNGQLHRVIEYKNGKVFNVKSFFDRNGNIIPFGTVLNGNGTLMNYDLITGKKVDFFTYINGIAHLIDTKIVKTPKGDIVQKTHKYSNGAIEKIVRELNGKLEGLQETYSYDGILKEANYYTQGKKNGTQTDYNDDGTIFWQNTYVNDKKFGAFKHTPEGQRAGVVVIDEGFYDEEEKLTGQYTSYLGKDRVVVASGKFDSNHKVGLWKYYNEFGVLIKETNFFDYNSNEQIVKEYNVIDGVSNLKNYTRYIDNKAEGKYEAYYFNTNLEVSGSYSKGKKNGNWRFYDIEGKVTKEKNYVKGKLVD